jgi:hypothetical protein
MVLFEPSSAPTIRRALLGDRCGQSLAEYVVLAIILVGTLIGGLSSLRDAEGAGLATETALIYSAQAAGGQGGGTPTTGGGAGPGGGPTGAAGGSPGWQGPQTWRQWVESYLPTRYQSYAYRFAELDNLTQQLDAFQRYGVNPRYRLELLARQQELLAALYPELLDRIRTGTTQERLDALSLLSRANNTEYLRGGAGDGDCFTSTLTTLWNVETGQSVQPLRYSDQQWQQLQAALLDGTAPEGLAYVGRPITGGMSSVQSQATLALGEGQMAHLASYTETGGQTTGHSTLVVRLDGQLYVINNQDWRPSAVTLSEWDTQWQLRGGNVSYVLYPTNTSIPRPQPTP